MFNHRGVTQILEQMTNAQNVCQLSRNEFMTYVWTCTNQTAYDIVSMNKFINRSIEEIYGTLLSTYDKSIDPEMAKIQLFNYRRSQNATLQEIESDIVELAAKSSLPYQGKSRISHFNHESIEGLIRSLPQNAKTRARDIQQELSTPSSLPTFHLFSIALKKFAHTINEELGDRRIFQGAILANSSYLPRRRNNQISERSGDSPYQSSFSSTPQHKSSDGRFQNGYKTFNINEMKNKV